MRKLTENILSLEAIDFQRRQSLFNDITAVVEESRRGPMSAIERLASIVKKHTGIEVETVEVYGDPDDKGPPMAGISFSLFEEPALQTLDLYLKKAVGKDRDNFTTAYTGVVNREKSTVSGIFAETPVLLYMKANLVWNEFYKPSEVAAVILHEIGHVFTSFEFLSEGIGRSVFLANATEEFFSIKDPKKREKYLIEISDEAPSVDERTDLVVMADIGKNRLYFQMVLEGSRLNKERAESSNALYAMRSSEQLADQFAVRHGAAKDLAIFMDKFDKKVGEVERRGRVNHLLIESSAVLSAALTPLAGFIYIPAGLFLSAYSIVAAIQSSEGPLEYDRPKERIEAFRNELISLAKQRDLSPQESKRLETEVDIIKNILEGYRNNRGFVETFFNIFSPSRRKKLKTVELQKELEELANNELFLSSVKLKNIALG